MIFTLNGTEYIIEEFHDIRMDNRNRGTSYFWSNGDNEGDCFATEEEAQQDAINYETGRDSREEAKAADWLLESIGDDKYNERVGK